MNPTIQIMTPLEAVDAGIYVPGALAADPRLHLLVVGDDIAAWSPDRADMERAANEGW